MDVVAVEEAAASAQRSFGALRQQGLQLVSECRVNLTSGVGGASSSSRISVIPTVSSSHIVLVFANYLNTFNLGEAWGDGLVTVSAALEYLSSSGVNSETGTRVVATFRGRRAGEMDPGALMYSDPIPFDAVAGTPFFVRVNFMTSSGDLLVPTGFSAQGGTGPGSVNNGEAGSTFAAIENGVIGSGLVSANRPGHVAVLGYVEGYVPSAGAIGDSICAGSGDNGFGANDGGFVVRALSGQLSKAYTYPITPPVPFVRVARPGESLYSFLRMGSVSGSTVSPSPLRSAIASLATTVISNYGINDFGSARTLDQLKADTVTVANHFLRKGKYFIQCTLLPNTTSTDGWATTANQTLRTFESDRAAFNTWLRSGAFAAATIKPGRVRAWDAAAALEVNASNVPTINGGYNKLSLAPTLSSVFTTGSTVTQWNDTTKAWTQDQWRGWMVRQTSGAGAGQQAVVLSNTATALLMGTGFSVAPSAGDAYQLYVSYTADGTHPSSDGAAAIAATFDTSWVK